MKLYSCNPKESVSAPKQGGIEKQNWEGTGKLVDQNKAVSITTLHRLLYLNVIDHQNLKSKIQRCKGVANKVE